MELRPHQQKILDDNPARWLLAWETRSGKTLAAILLANKNCEFSVLVVCPKGLKYNWQKTLKEHCTVRYYVISKEEFRRDWQVLSAYDGIIVDEAHYFAGMKSQLSKNMDKYLRKWDIRFRWFLTATPYLSSPWNIYMLGKLLGWALNYAYFKATFFYDVRFGMRVVPTPRPGMEEELKKIVTRIGSTVSLEDYLASPQELVEYFELTAGQKKAIDKLEETNFITRWTKMHQICGGTVAADEYNPVQVFPSMKRERLVGIAASHDRLIVVCRYLAEIDTLEAALSTDTPVFKLTGATKDRAILLEFLAAKKRFVLLVSASISEGWELLNVDLMVFYSCDFSLKNYIQMLGRIKSLDKPDKQNTYLHLVVDDSIDDDVYESMKAKQDFHISLYNPDD